MEDFINEIFDILMNMHNFILYIFLFLSAIIENLFPPIPGDTITAFGAFLVGTGKLDYLLVYVSTTLGSVLGFMVLVFVGRSLGSKYFHEKNLKNFSAKRIDKTEKWINKYGYYVVLSNRFLPGIRSVISIVSGITKLNILWIFILSLISASIWNLIWIHTGYLLGDNWSVVQEKIKILLQQYNIAAATFMIIIVIIILIYKKRNKEAISE